jgi:hypothetical protein
MAIKDLKRVKVNDHDIMALQESVYDFSRQINKTIADGVIITDEVINTAATSIPHGLNRAFVGWQILDIQGDARVWRDTSTTADNTKFLTLKASTAVTVSLWVF